jgi:DNA topoisomerase IA
MEELGIGRPSTYASILTVLRDREYVRMDKKRFIPEDKGRLVTAFLESSSSATSSTTSPPRSRSSSTWSRPAR